jgi:Pentapeptide repeats (9 copies)
LFALVTAYRRQRLAEAAHDYAQRVDAIQQAHRERLARNAEHDAAEQRITELYNAAAEQLASDKAPVRLTALYTLERLANDNSRHQQTIVCAHLRMQYTPPPADCPDPEEEHRERARRSATRYRAARDLRPAPTESGTGGPDPLEEHQVRLTAQRLLSTHLQPTAQHHWADISLDLTGATIADFTLNNCIVHHADFSQATFSGDAWFDKVTFCGNAWFGEATFCGNAGFAEATFSGNAWFGEATFSGDAAFDGATFSGHAGFSGTMFFGAAEFGGASFEAGLDMTPATVTDVAAGHVPPPGWQIEPSQGNAGRFFRTSAPPSGS